MFSSETIKVTAGTAEDAAKLLAAATETTAEKTNKTLPVDVDVFAEPEETAEEKDHRLRRAVAGDRVLEAQPAALASFVATMGNAAAAAAAGNLPQAEEYREQAQLWLRLAIQHVY